MKREPPFKGIRTLPPGMTCSASLLIIMSNRNIDFLPSWFGEHTKQLVGRDTGHEYKRNESEGVIAAAVLNRLSMWSSHDDDAKHAMPYAQADVVRYMAGTVDGSDSTAASGAARAVVSDFLKHATGQTIEGFIHMNTGEDNEAAHRDGSCLISEKSSKVDDATWNGFSRAYHTALDTMRVSGADSRVDHLGRDISQVVRHHAYLAKYADDMWRSSSIGEVLGAIA